MKNFYISDCHFFHRNCIVYDNRPWKSVEDGNEQMVNLWNSVVANDDVVYSLGDFIWGNYNHWREIISKLNGKIFFVKGNHDEYKFLRNICRDFPDKVIGFTEQTTVNDNGNFIVLNHCPIVFFQII